MQPLAIAVLVFAFAVLAAGIAFFVRATQAQAMASAERLRLDSERQEHLQTLAREADALKKETLLAAREEAHSLREAAEREARDVRALAQRSQDTAEERALQREQALEHRARSVAEAENALRSREAEMATLREDVDGLRERQIAELERLSGLTQEEARSQFLRRMEEDHRLEAARLVRQIEEEARQDGARKAREIVVQAIQRCAVSQVSETTVSVVPLPSDEMKGRIIGREGRNIRTFETLSGVDVIIDDTPEAVVLSAFDPVRREIARVALTSLVEDGRIHPSRIEEAIARAEDEIETRIREAGESAAVRAGVGGLHEDLVRVLGKLRYRTSYGQNVLDHSVEVAQLAAAMAAELGVDVDVSRRGGLLHDLGKAENLNGEGSHLDHSIELARKYGEAPEVVHAIAAHHGDVEFGSVEAVLVQVADAISASRPGARREMLETYIKRMQKLENVVSGIEGVERSFAVQAGRELRIIVSPAQFDDLSASQLARETAKKIEEECEYPGQIKVTVIRETRASEVAR